MPRLSADYNCLVAKAYQSHGRPQCISCTCPLGPQRPSSHHLPSLTSYGHPQTVANTAAECFRIGRPAWQWRRGSPSTPARCMGLGWKTGRWGRGWVAPQGRKAAARQLFSRPANVSFGGVGGGGRGRCSKPQHQWLKSCRATFQPPARNPLPGLGHPSPCQSTQAYPRAHCSPTPDSRAPLKRHISARLTHRGRLCWRVTGYEWQSCPGMCGAQP